MAQEVPAGANLPPIPITSHDRVYHADQRSNTISVYDPSSNTLLGVIRVIRSELAEPAVTGLSAIL
jgi:DNA-binding beta-propeller fold protein YncE